MITGFYHSRSLWFSPSSDSGCVGSCLSVPLPCVPVGKSVARRLLSSLHCRSMSSRQRPRLHPQSDRVTRSETPDAQPSLLLFPLFPWQEGLSLVFTSPLFWLCFSHTQSEGSGCSEALWTVWQKKNRGDLNLPLKHDEEMIRFVLFFKLWALYPWYNQ